MSENENQTLAQVQTSPLVEEIRKHLAAKQYAAAVSTLNDNKNWLDLKNNCWDLVPLISEHLNRQTLRNDTDRFACCEQLLEIVTEKSTPEEVLLELIEQIENAKDDVAFGAIINSTTKSLVRLPQKRKHSLAWVLAAIQSYLDKVPLPENRDLSGKETLLLDADENVNRISRLYERIGPFYRDLVKELLLDRECTDKTKRVEILRGFLLKLLGNPLASLDLECDLKTKSSARRNAERIMEFVVSVTPDPLALLEHDFEAESNEVHVPKISLACFFYLLLSEHVCIERTPKIYCPVYVLQNSLNLSTELLKRNEYETVKKGLLLAHALLCHLSDAHVPYYVLDSTAHCKFCAALTNVIVYNPVEDVRKRGIEIFKAYLFKFDHKGRYLCVSNLLNTLTHSGMLGYVITQYKDMLLEIFRSKDNQFSEFFSGVKLFEVLDKACHLNRGVETDMLDSSDQIIGALNLLRFLAIRDRHNVTQVWTYFETLEGTFLKPLRKGVLISKAHYELKIKELKDEGGKGEKEGKDASFSVTVAGEELGQMDDADKFRVLHSAINAFEVMESLMGRLRECIDENRGENI